MFWGKKLEPGKKNEAKLAITYLDLNMMNFFVFSFKFWINIFQSIIQISN